MPDTTALDVRINPIRPRWIFPPALPPPDIADPRPYRQPLLRVETSLDRRHAWPPDRMIQGRSRSSGGAISVTRSRIRAFFGNGARAITPSLKRTVQA